MGLTERTMIRTKTEKLETNVFFYVFNRVDATSIDY